MKSKKKTQDIIFKWLMTFCACLIIALLGLVLGYVIYQGAGLVDKQFLTGDFDSQTNYVNVVVGDSGLLADVEEIEYDNAEYIAITKLKKNSPLRDGIALSGDLYPLRSGDIIKKIDDDKTTDMSIAEYRSLESALAVNTTVKLKVVRPGEGILPLAMNTLYIIGLSLLFALPMAIFSAIFLAEYARPGKVLEIIRFATSSLAGIPSIIFGLFGMLAFVKVFNLGYSLLAGALTLSIVLLPTIIGQTEEAIKRVPLALKEGSLALGATKLQTIFKIMLPNSISGILVGVLLGVGRIVAESAALLLTAGTTAALATSAFKSASTLTVKAYAVAKETGDIKLASAIGLVAIALIIIVNALAKLVEQFDKMKGRV
ncbi:MAG: phosphate ABC transporter permease PstA [Eubacteriales bacterium]